ncbi:glycosyltransferase family 4 protein [Sediminibacterium goheungense]|uniref:Glycosyltransferase involved in cell wall biosynthesis n=1 Tax=Sediminibacterium goheungense TaxID=1086393 RepID=A0A4R6IWS6_9BACT|nr:glycosyltransferase family 1 protein [Sediminibacterium goheungense]TDO26355.1 glycosyltransferase involved in cell wall biosynthesis [Sediminibacterium goheungense]
MRIAINAIFLQNNPMEGYGHYTAEVIQRIISKHPNDEFLLLYDRPWDDNFFDQPNITRLLVTPAARHPLSFKYWYDVKATAAVKGWKADVWFQPYGFCSITSRVPQVLMIHDLAFKHYPAYISWYQRLYYRWFTPAFIKKAQKLITVSNFSKEDIAKTYRVGDGKMVVIPGAARQGFVPLEWEEKQAVKDGYADGREYFLFVGGIHPRKNLITLLKAFSHFKKWQHSNMKLLVAGRMAWQYEDLLEKLKTYKYREDVLLLGYLPETQLQRVTAAAYALVYPSWFEGFGLPILEAMQAGVPVICSNTSSMPEVAGDAAILTDPSNYEAMGKEMIALYRNESIRNAFVEKGLQRAKAFSWDETAQSVYKELEAAAVSR